MSTTNKKEPNKLKILHVVILNLMVIITIIMVFFYYRDITNTLKYNGNWVSMKTLLEKGVMGAFATMETPRALAGNQLDLGAWHGNQELFLKKIVKYDKLKFKFKHDGLSQFCFYYEVNGDTLSGIRFSGNPNFPSMDFKLLKGVFIEKRPFSANHPDAIWCTMNMVIKKDSLSITINEKEVYKKKTVHPFANVFGLRGGERSILIDNIWLSSKNKGVLFTEKFNNETLSHFALLLLSIGLLFFNFFLYLFRKNVIWIISTVIFCVLFSTGFWIYSKYYKQFMYKDSSKLTRDKPKVIDEKDKLKKFEYQKPENEIRIVFVGSSQTWGAGASSEKETFVEQFDNIIQQSDSFKKYICINTGISGQQSYKLLQFYKYVREDLQPDVMIVNLSFNDGAYNYPDDSFVINIQSFIDINKEFGIKSILIPEPSNPDHFDIEFNERVAHKRELMDSIGVHNNVPVIHMQPFIEQHMNDGFLFWDMVHLSSYGHKLFAEELYRQLVGVPIEKRDNEAKNDLSP